MMAAWFGQEAKLTYLPWPEWEARESPEDAAATLVHIACSPNSSIDKGRRLLGYEPRYSSFEAVQDAVRWLVEKGVVSVR